MRGTSRYGIDQESGLRRQKYLEQEMIDFNLIRHHQGVNRCFSEPHVPGLIEIGCELIGSPARIPWLPVSGSALRNLFQVPLRLSATSRGIVDFHLLKEVIDCVAALRSDLSAACPP